jgi:hypothetical protein
MRATLASRAQLSGALVYLARMIRRTVNAEAVFVG